MAILNRQQILRARDIRTQDVNVPEWGGDVRVRGATAEEWDGYTQSLYTSKVIDGETVQQDNYANAKALLIVQCVVDEKGERIFTDDEAAALARKSASASKRIFDAIKELSGQTKQARGIAEGNSGTGSGSGTSSPDISEEAA